LRRRRRREHLACQEFVEIVTDYLEDAMSDGDRARFEAHLSKCGGCARYLEQIRVTVDLTGRLHADDVDALGADARDELLAAFRSFRAGSG